MKSDNVCCLSVQNVLSFSWLSKNLKTKIHRTKILPVVLYGCETWSLTLKEERGLRVLRRIFGPKRDEVKGKLRKVHMEELNDVYCSPNIVRLIKSRRMRRAGNVARMRERRGAYRVLVGKPEGRSLLGRPRHRGRIILRWIFRNWDVGVWSESN